MELVKYDAMVTAIAVCEKVDEVKDIRDKAVALEAYAKQANNLEAERQCSLIRVRAERKCGQMLLDDKNKAKASGSNQYAKVERSIDKTAPKTLQELAISKDQSSTWQKLANVPDDEFEEAINMPGTIPNARHLVREQEPEPKRMDKDALYLWGTLRRFREMNLLDTDINALVQEWTEAMKEDAESIIPKLKKWVNNYE